jgi:predicted secreted protein
MATLKSFGVQVELGTTVFEGLTDVNISGRDTTGIDGTTHSSTAACREFIGGLTDNGTLELTGAFNGAHIGIVYLETNRGTVKPAEVTYSDGSKHNFDVVVAPASVTNPLDDKIEFSVSLKITGAITFTPAP